jgi:hypothetical protein
MQIVAIGCAGVIAAACGRGYGTPGASAPPSPITTTETTTETTLEPTTAPPSMSATSATEPALFATFRSAGRTLRVRQSNARKPYSQLGDRLPVPADIQVEFGAPGAEDVSARVVSRGVWDTGGLGDPIEVDPAGELGRWIWRADVSPGDYGLEVTFTISGGPVVVRAPIQVTPTQ